eukprot:s1673_g5.t1
MEDMGYICKRVNYKSGYDLSSRRGTNMLKLDFKLHPPRFSWVSLPCTRLSPLQNLTDRTELEWTNFEKKVGSDLKRATEVAEAISDGLDVRPDADFAWEWPTPAARGWRSKAIQVLLAKMQKLGRPVYWATFHGCAYGLMYKNIPILKSWTVPTSSKRLWLSLQRKCPGHPEHCQCRGVAAQASAYYPPQMVRAVTKAISHGWQDLEARQGISLSHDIEHYLLDIPVETYGEEEPEIYVHEIEVRKQLRETTPDLFALSRTSFPKEPPVGRKLELIKQQMLRVHRASGHASFGNLQRLLRARGAPAWSIELAGSLQCPACVESRKPMLHPPASTQDSPVLFEMIGTDIFEYEHDGKKFKLILWRDRASSYVITEFLQEYTGNWEPSAGHVVNSFMRWMMINPAPTWIISDAGVQYTSQEFQDFCMNSGIGLLTAPAEAHWLLGAEEGTIRILKAAVTRLLREEPSLTVANAFALASHGCNHTIGPSGFSAFQWVRGGATPQDPLLSGLDPKKAFGGLLRLKEKARIAVEQEHAKYKLSKLNNALGRSPMSYRVGALVMLWRQRMRPGKTSGHWQGPVRVLLQEGSTLWLGSGSTLICAKTNQCRECTKREELQATLDGVAVIQQPVTLETLLRSFTGRHYTNVTGEAPSAEQMEKDLSPTDVRAVPDPARQVPDARRGIRAPGPRPEPKMRAKSRRKSEPSMPVSSAPSGRDQHQPQDEAQPSDEIQGRMIPGTPSPGTPRPKTQDGRTRCSVHDCVLPGGHSGPHKDEAGKTFSWTLDGGRIELEGEQSDDDDSSSSESTSSSSSEELKPDGPDVKPTPMEDSTLKRKAPDEEDAMFVLEIEVDESTSQYLRSHPRKAAIWLSKRMQEKGREHQWQQLPLERKKDFDLAQAKELTNVLQSKALRSLSEQEWNNLDRRKCLQMRWVLTTKSDASAKARLVILGYQQHNLTEVQAAAPTMNRLSRNMLLTVCANKGFRLRSGDVTSAFLQANQSMEDDDLVVWVTPELAILYGAPPEHPYLPLKVVKPFYGLVHSPRAWYNDVAATLTKTKWRMLLSDRCLFTLYDEETDPENPELIAIAGVHVDDFLIGGKEDHPKFQEAISQLEKAYKWGKWETESFTYAGCHLKQMPDGTIYLDQVEYTSKWVDEIPITPERAKQIKDAATPSEVAQLRGAIGTLAWMSSQTGPHFQADVGLLLSEVPYATVNALLKANKLVREAKRTPQSLMLPSWRVPWTELAIVVWADASNSNRPDRSSTMGIIAGCAPSGILQGEKHAISLLQWRSSKTPRQCLGSNGAEVQSITEGEDLCFRLRALLAEVHGEKLTRQNLSKVVLEKTQGALVMDSKGIYDSMTRNVSALHGLKSGRAGYELTVSVSQALEVNTQLRWVCGISQLADVLTKGGAARTMFMRFLAEGQRWQLVHDPEFVAGKKVKKRALEERLRSMEQNFIAALERAAQMYRWPFRSTQDPVEFRIMGDDLTGHPWIQAYPINNDPIMTSDIPCVVDQ